MFTFGEVHTGLLQNSTPLTTDRAAEVLSPLCGAQLQRFERPMQRIITADRPIGVDCRLPAASGGNPHVVGTVLWHAGITGGHLAQSNVFAAVVPAAERRRMPWEHYTAFPGRLELLSDAKPEDLTQGYLHGRSRPNDLDTTAIATQAFDRLQRSQLLDRRPTLRTRRTRLRWTATGTGKTPQPITVTFRMVSEDLRTVDVKVADEFVPGVLGLCEDLALHDWLLTTVSRLLELTLTTRLGPVEKADQLRPAVEYFLHLWMPGARVDEVLKPVWQELDRRPGFSRQWDTSVARVRDQISLGTIELLKLTHALRRDA
ncbi:SCO2521 family protein [Solwaraspora sp. WMMD792]|uniref:SCO2521 family protein n=1 Tax=Solwaraspora sp. WMMD792 TaxID=3016099 RepID=UPI002415DA9E|nr:SCO2521 family protein [Solwaraspora sp. WMMD792]MDG4772711.1 SCO2521 family protein [Solwaraspora sp. WMMD792]